MESIFWRMCKKGIGLGVDDYVVGWAKNGFYVDEVLQRSDFQDYQGRLHWNTYILHSGEELNITLPEHTLSAIAYPGKINLKEYIKDRKLKWKPQLNEEKKYILLTQLHLPNYIRNMDNVWSKYTSIVLKKNLMHKGKKV